MIHITKFVSLLFIPLVVSSCSGSPPSIYADNIYFDGHIITMDTNLPSVEAVAVKDGKIIAVGSEQDIIRNYLGKSTKKINLQGHTLLPGFLDAHSHYFSSLMFAQQVNLYPPPFGPGRDIPSIISELKKHFEKYKISKGVLVEAYGYDSALMPNGIPLTRSDLDQEFPDNPILVVHVSMHGAVLNSAAMKIWNISAETVTPPGGVIMREPNSNRPQGLIMETAYLPIFNSRPKPTKDQIIALSIAGQKLYAKAGITTAQEGLTGAKDFELMKHAADANVNIIDIVSFPFITELDEILMKHPLASFGKYDHRLKLGGIKITGDGSPQATTAFFRAPYLKGGPSGEQNWTGNPTFAEDLLKKMVKKVYDLGLPLNFHANGDAAIDLFLGVHESVTTKENRDQQNVTVIHSQFMHAEQLDKYVEYNIRPSFYTLHTYFFADTHLVNRGEKQTDYIDPMRDAIDRGLQPTNHTDFVVAPLDQMFMLWAAVNRVSRSGKVIGADQRITPLEGLQAMTINVARQYQEENLKGSISVGKLADLVILDGNPLTVLPMKIKDIKVLETIKEGKSIYQF